MTNSDKVLELIYHHHNGLDDDEISEKTGIQPRQQIHQICSRLEGEGRIKRVSIQKRGKRRKIHNFPAVEEAIASGMEQDSAKMIDSDWRRKLTMLMAATGREEAELLDVAVRDLARKILSEEMNSRSG